MPGVGNNPLPSLDKFTSLYISAFCWCAYEGMLVTLGQNTP